MYNKKGFTHQHSYLYFARHFMCMCTGQYFVSKSLHVGRCEVSNHLNYLAKCKYCMPINTGHNSALFMFMFTLLFFYFNSLTIQKIQVLKEKLFAQSPSLYVIL